MTEEEIEKKASDYELKVCGINANQKIREAYINGFKECLKEWKNCFLSCSSPYCNSFFPNVTTSGELGRCEKKEK